MSLLYYRCPESSIPLRHLQFYVLASGRLVVDAQEFAGTQEYCRMAVHIGNFT